VEGREFICIDTGGIDGTEDGVETRMAEQSLLAIEEADVVLFMVDARWPDAGGLRYCQTPAFTRKADLPGGEQN
jgi:tRNA U34 5-carboxymethylaminomethyl modifying GTPase MnmE/TrmE